MLCTTVNIRCRSGHENPNILNSVLPHNTSMIVMFVGYIGWQQTRAISERCHAKSLSYDTTTSTHRSWLVKRRGRRRLEL